MKKYRLLRRTFRMTYQQFQDSPTLVIDTQRPCIVLSMSLFGEPELPTAQVNGDFVNFPLHRECIQLACGADIETFETVNTKITYNGGFPEASIADFVVYYLEKI